MKYLLFETEQEGLNRSQEICISQGCTGDTTTYWFGVIKHPLTEQGAMQVPEEQESLLTEQEVLAGIKEIVEEVAGVPGSDIEMSKNFTDDLDVDSLSMVEVVVAAEERFGIKIPDDQVSGMLTVGDAVNFIVKAAN
jgi:acyl carrier protein